MKKIKALIQKTFATLIVSVVALLPELPDLPDLPGGGSCPFPV